MRRHRSSFPFAIDSLKSVTLGPDGRRLPPADASRLNRRLARAERGRDVAAAVRALAMRGWLSLCRGRRAEALRRLGHAVTLSPHEPVYRLWRGVARKAAGDLEGAVGDFSAVIGSTPGAVTAYFGRSEALKNLGRIGEALDDARRLVELRPDDGAAWRLRARLLAQIGRAAEGLDDLDRSVVLEPRCGEAHAWRGELLRKLGRLEEAIAAFDAALRCRPLYRLALAWRAAALWSAGSPRALDGLRRAHRALPDYPPLSSWLAHAEAESRAGRSG